MALEVNGTPLKFVATFDGKKAEADIDAFLRSVSSKSSQNLQDFQPASKVIDDVVKKQKESITTSAAARESFMGLTEALKSVHTDMAKVRVEIRDLTSTQKSLDRALKDNVISEEAYIKKTAELSARRTELNEVLKKNRQELRQFQLIAERSANKPYTQADIEFAVANQHSLTGHPRGETLAPLESYTRRANEALKEYNAELEKLQQKLKNGEISQEQYGASVKRVESSIKLVNDELEYFVSNQSEKTTESFTRQRNLLDSVSDAYKEMVEDAIQVYGELSGQEKRYINQLNQLEQESKDLAAAQKELSDSYKNGDITQRQYVNASRALSIQQGEVKKRISDVNGEIQRNNAVEREAIGSIAQKTARLTQLQHQYNKLSEAQRNNEAVGGKLRAEYQKLSKEVQQLNTSLSGTKSGGIGNLFTSLRGIAGTMGIAFGAYQLVRFGKELFNIAQQVEGIELRFAKIGDTQGLEKLRAATKNTVADLELMKLAVRADNFRIPMDVLAKGLEFARRRANDTGQSVDYMTNSFVDGLGRKSSLVLDNLGISLVEIQEEVKKVGDYNQAVGNIIEREMRRAGSDVDTLADKTNKLAAEWQNLKTRISGAFNAIFNAGAPNSAQVERLTEAYRAQFDAIKSVNDSVRKEFIEGISQTLDDVENRLSKLTLDSDYFGDIYREQRGIGGKSPQELLRDLRRPLIEQQQALQAALNYAKAITDEMSTQERHAQGIYKISELEEKASNARKAFTDAIGDEARAEAQKELDKWETLLKKARGDKSATTKADRDLERERDKHADLLKQLASLDAEYTYTFLTQQEKEIKAVEDKYDALYAKAVEYNAKIKDPSNKIDLSLIEQGRETALDNAKVNQAHQEEIDGINKRINSLETLKEKYEAVNEEIRKMEGISADERSGAQNKAIHDWAKQSEGLKEQQEKDLQDLLKTLITYETKRENLIKEYQEKRKEIEAEGNAENLIVFDKQFREQLEALDDANVQTLDGYKDLFEGIEGLSDAMARKVIANARAMLAGLVSSGKISKDLAKEIEKQIKDTQKALDDRLPDRLDQLAAGFDQMAGSVSGLNDGLSSTLGLLSDALRAVGQVQNGIKGLTAGISNYKDNKAAGGGGIVGSISAIAGIAGPVGQIVGAVSGVVGGIIKILGAARRAREEARKYQMEIMAGEIDLNRAMRERARTQQNINDLTREEILLRGQLLEQQKQQAQSDYDRILAEIQKGVYESGTRRGKVPGTGFLGIGAKYMDFPEFSSLAGFTYEQLEELYFTKKLSEEGMRLFEQLQRAKKEVDDIAAAWDEGVEFIKDRMTGAISADSISSNIIKGLRDGKRAFADFADDAEEMIKDALLSAMAYTVLDAPLKELVEQFREDSLDGLDEGELQAFRDAYRSIVETGLEAIKDIEKITGPIGGPQQEAERFRGRISPSITEQTGNQIYAMELRKVDLLTAHGKLFADNNVMMDQQMVIMNNKLAVLNGIRDNTAATVDRLDTVVTRLDSIIRNTDSKEGRHGLYGA